MRGAPRISNFVSNLIFMWVLSSILIWILNPLSIYPRAPRPPSLTQSSELHLPPQRFCCVKTHRPQRFRDIPNILSKPVWRGDHLDKPIPNLRAVARGISPSRCCQCIEKSDFSPKNSRNSCWHHTSERQQT